jgi:ABC-2 type transport system ATP-binding protein
MRMSIVVNGLSKNYGTQKAVDSISFSLNKGEIVGFLGPNGAGKSTTLKMITGYLTPDSGTVTVGGLNVQQHLVAIKQKIGYLPESNPLYTDMYVTEYLHFIAGVHEIKQVASAVANAVALTGLTPEKHKKITQLSKGYKQRVGLAAALIHQPEVLILDEPTTGLDPNQIIEIRNVIKAQSVDKTILFSSHILQEVEAICDRVIIINKGKIVANNTLKNLQTTYQQKQLVKVRFDGEATQQLLQNLHPVEACVPIGNGQFAIQTTSPDEIRKQLLQLAIQHNLNIVSLQTDGSSLEEIFKSLTVV